MKIILLFIFIVSLNSCKKKDNFISKETKLSGEYIFPNASDRSSAYIENSKIVKYKNHIFLLILNYENKIFKLNIVNLIDYKIKTIKHIDNVIDNHGGGSIFINSKNKVCAIYGGYLEHLKLRCTKKV